MTDLISRQDAIALLEGKVCFGMSDWEAGFDAGIEKAIEALTNMPSAGISVKFEASQGSCRTCYIVGCL